MIFSRRQYLSALSPSLLRGTSIGRRSRRCTQPIAVIESHHDCGFAADWHANGFMFATANDDETVCIFDVRMLKAPQEILSTEVTASRSLHFSHDGRYLTSCESHDAVVV